VHIPSLSYIACHVVAQCAPAILSAGLNLQLPVMLLHLVSGIIGYYVPRALNYSEVVSRTMAIETAMKSSAFGFLLAKLHFPQYGVRVPSAVSVVWMALVGAILAVVWRFTPVKDGSDVAKPVK
jgi:BASS family bile acid:Na+ symporter